MVAAVQVMVAVVVVYSDGGGGGNGISSGSDNSTCHVMAAVAVPSLHSSIQNLHNI